jgi:Dehydrogenases with different specificities (related to short-chain alcohol dehydrogenases)
MMALAPLGFAALPGGARATEAAKPRAPKVVLVTGSSRGMGAAFARRFGREGFHVAVNYLKSRDLAAEVVRDIEQGGGRAISVQADVSEAAAVARLFDATEEAFGGVDVVINNAGIMRLAPFAEMKDDDFARLMDVNVKGGFNVLREAARRVRDGGRIISMSSSITQLRTATYGPYAASKAALEIFSSCLAKELRGRQISVNALAPGVVATSLFLDVPGRTEAEIQQFAARTPHGRIGTPEDLAAAMAALVDADAHWINGQTVFANGGLI